MPFWEKITETAPPKGILKKNKKGKRLSRLKAVFLVNCKALLCVRKEKR
jgi:hypothetical protein